MKSMKEQLKQRGRSIYNRETAQKRKIKRGVSWYLDLKSAPHFSQILSLEVFEDAWVRIDKCLILDMK